MKKYTAVIVLVAIMLFSLSSCAKVQVGAGEVTAVFRYGDADISTPLSDEDAQTVRRMFNGKTMFSDTPSCGFSENVALTIDGNTYCIACDACGTVYHVSEGRYFSLGDGENKTMLDLLGRYGFTFPCV